MVVDCILDRKDGSPYNPREFYQDMLAYEADDISRAMDEGTEEDVKKALCDYIKFNDYNPAICDYINSVNWLTSSNRRIKMDKKPVKSSEDKEKYWGAFGENGCVDFLTRKEFIEKFGEEPKDEDALDYVDSGCHGKDKKDKKKKPVKSSMSVEELPREALQELKQRYYAEKYDEDLSYGELADIDNIVSDEEVFDEYGGTSFTEDDFFCLANSRKAVKSSMPGKEKGIQAIMDEYGCTREEAIEIMNEEIQSSRKAVKSGLYDEANAFDPKDYDFGKVYNFIYDKYSKRIDRELNDLLYNIQEELGITTGDTFYDDNVEQCIKKLVEILADQYGNRS